VEEADQRSGLAEGPDAVLLRLLANDERGKPYLTAIQRAEARLGSEPR
jgi:hypothetical protein